MAGAAGYGQAIATILQSTGQVIAGNQANAAARSAASQMERNAGQVRAVSQLQAAEVDRQAQLQQSRLRALAGGGGADGTIVDLSQDIAGEGELRALSALFEGESQARNMEFQAATTRWEGKQQRAASRIAAVSTVLDGGSRAWEKYGSIFEADLNRMFGQQYSRVATRDYGTNGGFGWKGGSGGM